MALESFENIRVAEFLNENFISIKVDREERPDIDRIYMNVCQILTGSGGWPLSVFIDADKRPIYAGTYYPPQAFIYLLKQINKLWRKNKDQLIKHGNIIIEKMKINEINPAKINYITVEDGYQELKLNYDSNYGGFSYAPKFPMPYYIFFLLKYYRCYKKEEALRMAQKTLDAMRKGGIYDQIGFGFCRYSTDRKWMVPHFEKMLYDNASLLFVYAEAYDITRKEIYHQTVYEIADYLVHRLRSPIGGFYTAEDADSEGEEGKFYLFDYDEIQNVLRDKADIFCRVFNITPEGNFKGANIPYLTSEISLSDKNIIEQGRKLLFDYREQRERPLIDNKILTSQNGLVIAAFAICGRILKNDYFIEVAEETAEFIFKNININGKLYARYCEGEVKYNAYADDYAALLFGIIELYQSTFKKKYLDYAIEVNNAFFNSYYDIINGGYFLTANDSETVIIRQKEIYDGVMPSANALQILNLYRLSALTNNIKFYETAEKTLRLFMSDIKSHPIGHIYSLLTILIRYFGSVDITVKTADCHIIEDFKTVISNLEWPFINARVIKKHLETPEISVCKKGICYPPFSDLEQLIEMVKPI